MIDPRKREELSEAIRGTPAYTVDELLAITATDRELADDVWLSLGFPLIDADDHRKNYADADVEALTSLRELLTSGSVERETLMSMTRVMGQALARVANAQVHMFSRELQALVESSDDPDHTGSDDAGRAATTEVLVAGVDRFVSYCYRRHLLAALDQVLDGNQRQPVIGFVDLVGFTRSTRQVDERELVEIVSHFEAHVYGAITNSGARLRKQLGDGVMFDAPDAATAATAALSLVLRCAEDPLLNGARAGLALGPVLERDGDIYGETVNRASRLAALAHPHTVLADNAVCESMVGSADFAVKKIGSRPVKGLGHIDVAVIRPAWR